MDEGALVNSGDVLVVGRAEVLVSVSVSVLELTILVVATFLGTRGKVDLLAG